jgi:hypothetical protein
VLAYGKKLCYNIPQVVKEGGQRMNFLDKIVEKWNWLKDKVRPVWDATKKVFSMVGRVFAVIWKAIFSLRGILISAPVAAAALLVASWAEKKLPEVVEITHVVIDREAENALFGLFVMTTEYITRDVAIFVPLALTGFCLLMTILSKKTLYPWLISIFTLCLPIVMYFLNTYPM